MGDEGFYLPDCQTDLDMVQLSLLFCNFINTNVYLHRLLLKSSMVILIQMQTLDFLQPIFILASSKFAKRFLVIYRDLQ